MNWVELGRETDSSPCPSLRKDWKSPPDRVGQQPLTLIWGNTDVASCLVYLYARRQSSVHIWILLVRGSLNSVFAQSCQQGFIGTSGLWSFELHFWHFAKRHCFCMIPVSQDFLMPVYGEVTNWKYVSISLAMSAHKWWWLLNKFTDQEIYVCVYWGGGGDRHSMSAKKVLPTLTQMWQTNVSFVGFSVSVLIEVCF